MANCKHLKSGVDRGELVCLKCGLVLEERISDEAHRRIRSVRLGTVKPLSEEIVIRGRTITASELKRYEGHYVYSANYATLFIPRNLLYRVLRKGKLQERVRRAMEIAYMQNSLLSLEDLERILKASKGGISKALAGISDKIEYHYSVNVKARPNGVYFKRGSGEEEYYNLGRGGV